MKWNVYYYNHSLKKIKTYNIFDHGRFKEDVIKSLRRSLSKEEFAKRLKQDLTYYFWSKSEWELLFYPWIGDDAAAVKIDVFDQVMKNFNILVDYIWEFRKTFEEYTEEVQTYVDYLTSDKDCYVNLTELVERFVEIDEEYNHENWNLMQILANFNLMDVVKIKEIDEGDK